VDVLRGRVFRADKFQQRRQPIFEAADAVGGCAGRDVAFPSDDRGLVNAGFVEVALAAAEAAGGIEEIATLSGERVEDRTIIGREDEDGVVDEAGFANRGDDLSYVAV